MNLLSQDTMLVKEKEARGRPVASAAEQP